MEKENLATIAPIKKSRAVKKTKEKKIELMKRVVLPMTRIVKNTEIIKGEFGEFDCTNFLPHEEKEELAVQIVEKSVIFESELGRGYVVINEQAEMTLGLLAGYTNLEIPVEGRYDFYAYVQHSGLMNEVMNVIFSDAEIVIDMVESLKKSAIDRFNYSNSVDHYFKEISSGTQAGSDLLDIINSVSANQNNTAAQITNKMQDLQSDQASGGIIDFSKRKK